MTSFYEKLRYKNDYRQLRLELGNAMRGYMAATLNIHTDSVYAGFHTDAGYVIFKNSPRRHRVYMIYDWLTVEDNIIVKIVFQNPKVRKDPIQVRITRHTINKGFFSQLRAYIILRQFGDDEGALNFISYQKNNVIHRLNIPHRLLAKRSLTTVLAEILNHGTNDETDTYFLNRQFDICRVGIDGKRYIFTLSTYTDLIDDAVIAKLESIDHNDPNRIIQVKMGTDLLRLFKEYSDYVYTDALSQTH